MSDLKQMSASAFLDDRLYAHVMGFDLKDPKDFTKMMDELYKMSKDSWAPKCYEGMTNNEVKTLLDRTFSAWELFMTKLKKEDYFLADMVEKYCYKTIFMANEKMKEVYTGLDKH